VFFQFLFNADFFANEKKLLLSFGAKVNKQDGEGNSPLIHGAKNGHVEIVRFLKVAGADMTFRNNSGFSAADYTEDKIVLKALLGVEIFAECNLTRPSERLLLMRGALWNVEGSVELFTDADSWPIWRSLLVDENDISRMCEWKLVIMSNDDLKGMRWEGGQNRLDDRCQCEWRTKFRE
jgi:hypothetical protein